MKKLLFLAIFLLSAGLTQAQEWEYVATWGKDGDFTSFYDLESVNLGFNYTEVWEKTVYNTPQYYDDKRMDYSITKYRYNCTEKTRVILEKYIYLKDGTKIDYTPDEVIEMKTEPGTNGAFFMDFYCK